MPTDSEELRVRLLENNEEFRRLAAQHKDLDQRLHSLSSRPYLTEPEQLEAVTLKKRKLQLKDRMESMLRRYRAMTTAASGAEPSKSAAHG